MRPMLITLVALVVSAVSIAAQPRDGDLIVTMIYPTLVRSGGFTLSVDPATGRYTTLLQPDARSVHQWARMAPDNVDVVVGTTDSEARNGGLMVGVNPTGTTQYLIGGGGLLGVGGFELDHDDCWIIAGAAMRSGSNHTSGLWSLGHSSGVLSTLFFAKVSGEFKDVAIDRGPGAPTYAIGVFQNGVSTLAQPKVVGADRTGIVSTLVLGASSQSHPQNFLKGIELDEMTGTYLVTDTTKPSVARVDRAGRVTTLAFNGPAFGARIAQDGTAWITSHGTSKPVISQIDRAGNVIRVVTINGLPFLYVGALSVEIYGSRRLVCQGSGLPGNRMNIKLRSHRAGDALKPYAIALSFARRPGVQFPNGERLHLAQDPLFQLSVANANPRIFVDFQGTTDQFGAASAAVDVPFSLPSGTGLSVFAAGIIYDAGGVRTVTNTHAFEIR